MTITKYVLLTAALLSIAGIAYGQTETAISTEPAAETPAVKEREKADFPETEIFLFDLDLANTENPLSNGQNVTNRSGYDNQPYFTKDSDSFLYSRSDDYQTDAYEYFLKTGEHKRLTHSDKSKFSPTPSPDNSQLSFVFERNNSIWHADRGDEDNPKWSMEVPAIEEPVGYFARNYETGDILYWSRYGFNVSLTNVDKQAYHYVAGNAVPSTPHIIPGTNNFSFVHRQANGEVWIKELDPITKSVRPLTPIVGQNANYGWTPNGSILMIENDKLYRIIPDSDKDTDPSWEEVADLAMHGVKNANRVAISPNGAKLAVVGLPTGN
jgi:hypothetical protein